jgi:hypothetical protein
VTRLAAFGRFLWDFVIGDDWVCAAGVVIGLAATAALGEDAWWLLPLVAVAVLYISLRRAIGARR